ncbi:hypothetical protein B0H13DRAFT_1909493 [Mycena leptocephala]|nr:hypothetical protein B0H13DRAFT_1909493 [Mycena leptocephala]
MAFAIAPLHAPSASSLLPSSGTQNAIDVYNKENTSIRSHDGIRDAASNWMRSGKERADSSTRSRVESSLDEMQREEVHGTALLGRQAIAENRRLDIKMRTLRWRSKSTRSGNRLGGWKENDRSQATKERKKK